MSLDSVWNEKCFKIHELWSDICANISNLCMAFVSDARAQGQLQKGAKFFVKQFPPPQKKKYKGKEQNYGKTQLQSKEQKSRLGGGGCPLPCARLWFVSTADRNARLHMSRSLHPDPKKTLKSMAVELFKIIFWTEVKYSVNISTTILSIYTNMDYYLCLSLGSYTGLFWVGSGSGQSQFFFICLLRERWM